MIGIYKITNPKGKIYIGQSIDIETRWKAYKSLKCRLQPKIYRSLIKYGVEKHKFEIIHLCSEFELNEFEKYYVDLFQTFNNKNGLNLKDGGGARGKLSDEAKLKISLCKKGRTLSDEHRKNISLGNTGKKMSPEALQKLIKNNTGRKMSDATKLKLSLANLGKKRSDESVFKTTLKNTGKRHSAESKLKMTLNGSKIILNVETGIFYIGVREAANSISINADILKSRLNGRRKNNTNLINVENGN